MPQRDTRFLLSLPMSFPPWRCERKHTIMPPSSSRTAARYDVTTLVCVKKGCVPSLIITWTSLILCTARET